jgi:hypothetical protein
MRDYNTKGCIQKVVNSEIALFVAFPTLQCASAECCTGVDGMLKVGHPGFFRQVLAVCYRGSCGDVAWLPTISFVQTVVNSKLSFQGPFGTC